jgi:hypothetical protein
VDSIDERPPYFIDLEQAPKFSQMEGLETTVLTGLHGEQMMMVLNLSYTLKWTPLGWRERVEQALTVRHLSRAEVERRCGVIGDLFAECRERLVGGKTEGLETIEARKLEMLRAVRDRGAMPASEFDRRFGLRRAIQSPFFHLLRQETREGEEWLAFDEGRLQERAARDFEGFLEWDRALLRVLVEKTNVGLVQ